MISEETIEQVRRATSIVRVIGERVKLQQKGRYHLGLCPFHKEKTPSFQVNDERGFYHCFGCKASGDAIKFLREFEGLDFVEAVRLLAEQEGIAIKETGTDRERKEEAAARRRREELYEVGNTAATYFEKQLLEHPLAFLAREELARRGLVASSPTGPIADALQAFRVGYAPYGWDGLSRHLKSLGLGSRAAEAVGLLVPRKSGPGHYDRFRNRLMFAVMDLQGRVIAFSGRALREPSDQELQAARLPRTGSGQPQDKPAKYVNSPEGPVYRKREAVFGLWQGRQAVRQADSCVLVEGNFDVLSLHARGIHNVVAPLGTAFTPEQGKQIKRFTENVTLLFDGDSAGRRAVEAARNPCQELGLQARVATLPEGKDPDDLVREQGKDGVLRVVGAARSLLEHLIESTLDAGFRADDAHSKDRRIRAVMELLESEKDPTVRRMAERHADAIAARLGIADADTLEALKRRVWSDLHRGNEAPREESRQPHVEPPERARSRDRRRDIARELMGAILDFPELLEDPDSVELFDLAEGNLALALLQLRQARVDGNLAPGSPTHVEQVLANLPESMHAFASRRLAAPRHQTLDDARAELLGNLGQLRKLMLAREKAQTVEELHKVAASGDFEAELVLLGALSKKAKERFNR